MAEAVSCRLLKAKVRFQLEFRLTGFCGGEISKYFSGYVTIWKYSVCVIILQYYPDRSTLSIHHTCLHLIYLLKLILRNIYNLCAHIFYTSISQLFHVTLQLSLTSYIKYDTNSCIKCLNEIRI